MIPFFGAVCDSLRIEQSDIVFDIDPYFSYVKWYLPLLNDYALDGSIGMVYKKTSSSNTLLETELLKFSGRYSKNAVYLCPPQVNNLYLTAKNYIKQTPSQYYYLNNDDFCFECDVVILPRIINGSRSGYHKLMSISSGTGGDFISVNSEDLRLQYYCYADNVYVDCGVSVTEFEWTHIAISRSQMIARIFVNGSLVASRLQSSSDASIPVAPIIGQDIVKYISTQGPHGVFDNIKFSLGLARYTGAFAELQNPIGFDGDIDKFKYNRACAVKYNQASCSDNSPYSNLVTINAGSYTSPSTLIDSDGSLFCGTESGASSVISPSASGCFLMHDFENTYEISFNQTSRSHDSILFEVYALSAYGSHPNYMRAIIDSYGYLKVNFIENNQDAVGITTRSGNISIATDYVISTNTTYKIMICMSGDLIYIFVNGVLIKKHSTLTTNTSNHGDYYWMTAPCFASEPILNIGGSNYDTQLVFSGYVDNVFLTKGVAIHKDSFVI